AGVVFLLGQFVCISDLKLNVGIVGLDVNIGLNAVILPLLAIVLLVYITEGALTSQRFIIGLLAIFGIYNYVSDMTADQLSWNHMAESSPLIANTFLTIITANKYSLLASSCAMLANLFLMPMVFVKIRNLKYNLFMSIFSALLIGWVIMTLIYANIVYPAEEWYQEVAASFINGLVLVTILSALMFVYLKLLEADRLEIRRSPLDLFYSFFGAYGKSKILEKSVKEWEDRFKLIMANASEIILILNTDGIIIDGNPAAAQLLKNSTAEDITGLNFLNMLRNESNLPITMNELLNAAAQQQEGANIFRAFLPDANHKLRCLNLSLSEFMLQNEPVLIVMAQDLTLENQLANEKEQLSNQLAHSQRLEAIGKLAGGIAHDFNNHLHAIMGHIDLIKLFHRVDDDKISEHLNKIMKISEQSGLLTSQLLGFARKGKYVESNQNLCTIIEQSMELFLPERSFNVTINLKLPPFPLPTRGDRVQLQQTVLNLLFNAVDAVKGRPSRMIEISAGLATDCHVRLRPPLIDRLPREIDPAKYCFLRVKDNGMGMNEETMNKIFEPFFT
ncbi:MAG: ATP-binding protein, partial [Victivallaceae bacterium]